MDELQSRLERLAPQAADLGVDAALAGVHAAGRRRLARRRALVAAAALLVVVVLASGVALAGRGTDETDLATADIDHGVEGSSGSGTTSLRTTGTAEPGTTIAPDPSAPPDSAVTVPTTAVTSPVVTAPTATEPPPTPIAPEAPLGPLAAPAEIEVVITPDRTSVVVGERVRFRVDVTNRSVEQALFQSGGCGPIEATAVGPNGPRNGSLPWDGAPATLVAFVAGHDIARPSVANDLTSGSAPTTCTADLRSDALAPGATTSRSYAVDAFVRPPSGSSPSQVVFTAGVDVVLGPHVFSSSERREVSVTIPVIDDQRAHASPDGFLGHVDADPVVSEWVQHNRPIGDLGYTVLLSYANGGFELTIDNHLRVLRVRGATATGAITEIRTYQSGVAPGDDPDATFRDPAEQILFSG